MREKCFLDIAELDNIVAKAENKVKRLKCLQQIADELTRNYKFSALVFHNADEEHDEPWYSEPTPDDYEYDAYLAYQDVFKAITELMEQ